MKDYNTSKFSDAFAEAADQVLSTGLSGAMTLGSVSEDGINYAYVEIDLSEDFHHFEDIELIEGVVSACAENNPLLSPSMTIYVVIETTEQGFINTMLVTDLQAEASEFWMQLENEFDRAMKASV